MNLKTTPEKGFFLWHTHTQSKQIKVLNSPFYCSPPFFSGNTIISLMNILWWLYVGSTVQYYIFSSKPLFATIASWVGGRSVDPKYTWGATNDSNHSPVFTSAFKALRGGTWSQLGTRRCHAEHHADGHGWPKEREEGSKGTPQCHAKPPWK